MVFSIGNIIRNVLKNGIDTSYFLLGNDYFMQKIFIQKIKEYLNNQANTEYFYFNEQIDIDSFFDSITSMSLFNNKNIFIIKNFNRLLSNYQNTLNEYLKHSNSDNILIFILDDYVIKNKFSKLISKQATIVDTRTPINKIKLREWVRYYYKKENININNTILDYLIDNYSDDISTIINEIEKHYLINQEKIINSNIISTDYQSKHIKIWNLLDSLGQKKLEKAIIHYNNLYTNGNSLVPILISLYNFYSELINLYNSQEKSTYSTLNKILQSRMNIYKTKYKENEILNIFLILRNIDINIKTNVIDEKILFSSIIIKICNGFYDKK